MSLTLQKVASLLAKLQERLNRTASETRHNTDLIAALQDRVRLDVGALSAGLRLQKSSIETLAAANKATKVENDKREAAQTLRDQNNVQSLVNLRDSTQKGFDQVRGDVESLLKAIQRLNERMGQVESQNIALAQKTDSPAWHHMVGLEKRITQIETRLSYPAPAPSIPTDHVWVNKKLTGVYDSVEDLDDRVQNLESLIELYENLRKAQNAFAVANGEFLAGPKT